MSICFGTIRDITLPEAELFGEAEPEYEVTNEDTGEIFMFKNIRDAIEADSYINRIKGEETNRKRDEKDRIENELARLRGDEDVDNDDYDDGDDEGGDEEEVSDEAAVNPESQQPELSENADQIVSKETTDSQGQDQQPSQKDQKGSGSQTTLEVPADSQGNVGDKASSAVSSESPTTDSQGQDQQSSQKDQKASRPQTTLDATAQQQPEEASNRSARPKTLEERQLERKLERLKRQLQWSMNDGI